MNAKESLFVGAEPWSVSESFFQRSCGYQANGRELFYHLIHLSSHRAVLPVAYQFVKHYLTSTKADFYPSRCALDSAEALLAVKSSKLILPASIDFTACLEQVTPLLQTTPRWLDYVLTVATGENDIAMALLTISEQLKRSRVTADDLHLVVVSKNYSQYSGSVSPIFDLAAVQLTLAQFPRTFLPEILGFTLAYCQQSSVLDFLAEGLSDKSQQGTRNALLMDAAVIRTGQVGALQLLIRRYETETQSEQDESIWLRIQQGYGLYGELTERCVKAISEHWNRSQTDDQLVAALFKKLALSAKGHHGQAELGGKRLDHWFSEEPFNSREFMAALAASSYVNLKAIERSPLLALFDFNGPMFGVLNHKDLALLKRWLNTGGSQSTEQSINTELSTQVVRNESQALCRQTIPFDRLSNRNFFYYLVNSESYPEVIDSATGRVTRVLRLGRWLNKVPFKEYKHSRLDQFIETIYQRGIAAYQPFKAPPRVSKATYIWGIEQFAPTILADGCWLQGVSRLQFSPYQAVGDLLQKIYSDEMGNGEVLKNHPSIYRRLLTSLNIELPRVHTRAFSTHRRFLESAFDIPVFLTALSLCGNRFLPELLGVNLAIELSGLGRQYMTLRDELNYWQIDSSIVDVHIAIDNIATGHTALAREAITLYLDQVQVMDGSEMMNQHWRRVYQGYSALNIASARFKAALVLHYLNKKRV